MKSSLDSLLLVSEEGLYPIRTVSEVTGVNAITLRAWERRYGLFKPQRTAKGHRLYSEEDILRIKQVLKLLDKGISIGRVLNVLDSESPPVSLVDLPTSSKKSNGGSVPIDVWKQYQADILATICQYDIAKTERLHHEIFSLYPIELVTKNLILPTLNDLKDQLKQLPSLSGSYHFYLNFLQQKLGGLFLKHTLQNHGKKLLLIGIGDSYCDIELLLFSMPLITHGYQVVTLGCLSSIDALPMTLSNANADGLIIFKQSSQNEFKETVEIDENIPKPIKMMAENLDISIFVAGDLSKIQAKADDLNGLVMLPNETSELVEVVNQNLKKENK